MSDTTDLLVEIEAIHNSVGGWQRGSHYHRGILLDLARKQQAALDAVKSIAESWDEYPSSPEGRCAREIRKALEAAA